MVDIDPVSALHGNPHDADLAPSRIARPVQRGLLGVFLLGLVGVAFYLITEHWRRATFLLGADLVWLAAVRACCDSQVLGVLAVRSQRFDVLFSAGMGVITMFLAASIDSLGS